MDSGTLIKSLFERPVTRDIPPVVYFHEQSPDKLEAEVSEYIVTGGWPEGNPNHRRVPNGIHEQYVGLLNAMAAELEKPGGPELPACWISGFYGSGKSIFAKLLGLALDDKVLPSGLPLAEAWLRRDVSPRAAELREAWQTLRQRINPVSVVFDIGSVARDNEQIHSAVVRQVQRRLGYCREPLVAEFELKLERDGEWARFERVAAETLGTPWAEVKERALAEEEFSRAMAAAFPATYSDPMSWFTSRAGTSSRSLAPEEATRAIIDMMRVRAPGKTLFVVVDEVSQYIHQNEARMLALQSFVADLGQRMRGAAWLLVTGQEKLDEAGDRRVLAKMQDRFPPRLRAHLAATNIRDVVHKRLLAKKVEVQPALRELYRQNLRTLQLLAYDGGKLTEDDFVDVYPMLPGQIDLILQVTSALRLRSSRSQGDDQAIRGLLQLLGELFRGRRLAEKPVGALVTLDQVYEVQHSALDSDAQASMARVLARYRDEDDDLPVRVAKVVALLELIQETVPTTVQLVAQCLFERVDGPNREREVRAALERLRNENLLGYSEKHGYKLQSSAGEEWERERHDVPVSLEKISELVREALTYLMALPEQPRHMGRPFPWAAFYSDGRAASDVRLADPRKDAAVQVDLRFLSNARQLEFDWIQQSDSPQLRGRLVWIGRAMDEIESAARELGRTQGMVRRYADRRGTMLPTRKLLLQQEEIREETLTTRLREVVDAAWVGGRLLFRGRELPTRELGTSFAGVLQAAGARVLPELYPHFVATTVTNGELEQLLAAELVGPSPKFLAAELGILELDAGRYMPSCTGTIPRRVLELIEHEHAIEGEALLKHFGSPPYGYTPELVKACVAGLLRGSRLRVQTEDGATLTAPRDAGTRDLFDKDRVFRKATLVPAGEDDIGYPVRAQICALFREHFGEDLDREDGSIADSVARNFPIQVRRLRSVHQRLQRLPGAVAAPEAFTRLERAIEDCLRVSRQSAETVKQVKRHLAALREGLLLLAALDTELTDDVLAAVRRAADVRDLQAAQLAELGRLTPELEQAVGRVRRHLASERPWREIVGLEPDLIVLTGAYANERRALLTWQQELVEAACQRVSAREGFDTLSADQAHDVQRPLRRALSDTTAEAVAPTLAALREPFEAALERARDDADRTLDRLLNQGQRVTVRSVRLEIRNRELATRADLDALLAEIRERILPALDKGERVRLS